MALALLVLSKPHCLLGSTDSNLPISQVTFPVMKLSELDPKSMGVFQ